MVPVGPYFDWWLTRTTKKCESEQVRHVPNILAQMPDIQYHLVQVYLVRDQLPRSVRRIHRGISHPEVVPRPQDVARLDTKSTFIARGKGLHDDRKYRSPFMFKHTPDSILPETGRIEYFCIGQINSLS